MHIAVYEPVNSGIDPLHFHVQASDEDAIWAPTFRGHPQMGGDPRVDAELTGGIVHLIWPRNSPGSLWRSWCCCETDS